MGSGLAGLRSAISAASVDRNLRVAVISKVQVMRSHSVSAEGGTAAVLFEEEGDNRESHIYDTIRGSDFLADQDVAERLVSEVPYEIYQLRSLGNALVEKSRWTDRSEEIRWILVPSCDVRPR